MTAGLTALRCSAALILPAEARRQATEKATKTSAKTSRLPTRLTGLSLVCLSLIRVPRSAAKQLFDQFCCVHDLPRLCAEFLQTAPGQPMPRA